MNSMRNLEKLGILVIVILVVVVGVVAITPGEQLDKALDLVPERDSQARAEPEPLPDADRDEPVRPPETDRGGARLANVPDEDRGSEPDIRPVWPEEDRDQDDLRAEPPVRPVEPQPKPEPKVDPTPVAPRTYTVQKGDSYYRIAERVLRDIKLVKALMAANPSIRPQDLKPGDVLTLPGPSGAAPSEAPSAPKTPAAPRAVPEVEGPGGIYVVRSRDTLTGIAARELGTSTRWRDIARLNSDILKGSTDIRPGMRLRLPGPRAVPVSPGALVAMDPAARTTGRTYVVRAKDTLSSIARDELGSTGRWKEIVELNDDVLHGSHVIRAGLELRLPAR